MSEPNPELNQNPSPPKKEIIKTWHAVTGGIAAAATPEIIKLVKQHKKLSTPTDTRNIFEPGQHTISDEEDKLVEASFNRGDPDAHDWMPNPELETRLASFAPQILTIDGSIITRPGEKIFKKIIWLGCPARPRKINQLGFYTVSGDIPTYKYIGDEVVEWTGNPYNSAINEETKLLTKNESIYPMYPDHLNKQQNIALAEFITSAFLAGVYTGSKSSQETDQPINRRAYLKGLVAGTAALTADGLLKIYKSRIQKHGTFNAARSITEQQKELWQTLLDYTDNMPPTISLDGRTATLIAKHEDAMDLLRENKYLTESAKGAIIMGRAHARKADLYMHDKASRDVAILAYTKEIIGIADKFIFNHFNLPPQKRTEITNRILDYFAQTQINHVSDPGIAPGVSLPDYIETNIQPVTTFKSPQVENAIKSLRP